MGLDSSNPMLPRQRTCRRAAAIIHIFCSSSPVAPSTPLRPSPRSSEYSRQGPPRSRTSRPSGRPAPPLPRRSSSRSTARAGSRSPSCSPTRPSRIDDIAVIRSMHADVPNHEPSLMLDELRRRRVSSAPSMGAWVTVRPGDREPEPPRLHRHVPGGMPITRSRANWRVIVPPRCLPGDPTSTPSTRTIEKLVPDIRNKDPLAGAAAAAARSPADP